MTEHQGHDLAVRAVARHDGDGDPYLYCSTCNEVIIHAGEDGFRCTYDAALDRLVVSL